MTSPLPALRFCISPCPNDTFIFENLLSGKVEGFPFAIKSTLADVESCNRMVLSGEVDIAKISCGLLNKLGPQWHVLTCGGAVSWDSGPLLLANGNFSWNKELPTLLPGEHTTASRLFHLWCKARHGNEFPKVIHQPYDELYREICSGVEPRQGVVIHEMRFTYLNDGLLLQQDLGGWWVKEYNMPLPLGIIVCHERILPWVNEVEQAIRYSLQQALHRKNLCTDFICLHAQSMSREVMEQHIRTFVTDYSMKMDISILKPWR